MKVDTRKLLMLTRRRMKNLSLRKPFKDNLSRLIAKNASAHLHGATNLGNLPVSLRELVLKELTALRCKKFNGEGQEHFEKLAKAVSLLIGHHTTIFELGGLMSYCCQDDIPVNTNEILRTLSTKATNLEQLNLNINSRYYTNEALNLGNSSELLIASMEKLKILKITTIYWIGYETVKFICKSLNNLLFAEFRHMEFPANMKLSELDADIDDIKMSFSRLRVFLFPYFTTSLESHAKYKKLKLLCVKHLPNLKVVHQFENTSQFGYVIKKSSMPAGTSALEHLCAEPGYYDLHKTFPNVTHLKVNWRKNVQKFENLLKFKSIECLNLNILPSTSTVNVFLKTYGLNLHTLYINLDSTCVQTGLSFKSIFAACPKLETLHLFNVKITDDKEHIAFFAKLKEFDFASVDTFHVTNILSAPDLEKVSLTDCLNFEIKDLQRLTSLIIDQKILLKLTHFELSAGHITYKDAKLNVLDALSSLVANAAAFLPYLVGIKFDIGYYDFKEWVDLQLHKIEKEKRKSSSGKRFREWIQDGDIYRFFHELS